MQASTGLVEALRSFATTLTRIFRLNIQANPEDQLKAPVGALLNNIGPMFGIQIQAVTEAQVDEIGRPDMAVSKNGLLTGYIELKAPGKGADTRRFTGRDQKQWNRFKALPNLVYTDGSDWALYRDGVRVQRVMLTGDVTTGGTRAVGDNDGAALERLFRDFLSWDPITPRTPRALVEVLAPLCRLVRDDVVRAMERENTAISALAAEWRLYLFPDADDATFADAYAQTLTYSLLLARLSGTQVLNTDSAAQQLRNGHGLLGQTLRLLGQPEAREEIALGVDLLERTIKAVDVLALSKEGDPWLYFYEDFLAEYDPKLRGDRGVYYTPVQVVQAQVRLASQLLVDKFGKTYSYADRDVVVLDPAAGTGTYILVYLPLCSTESNALRLCMVRQRLAMQRARWQRTCTHSRYSLAHTLSPICVYPSG